MKIDEVVLREIHLPLKRFFETSFGRVRRRRVLLVAVRSGDLTGWGECVADDGPFFSPETVDTAWPILVRFLIPRLFQEPPAEPSELPARVRSIRGHPMAKAALEAALWDLHSQRLGVPLWHALGGTLRMIPCGVSIGIQEQPSDLLERIQKELEAGYRKIKIKIRPGWDLEIVRRVRSEFPEIPLMVDANSAYSMDDLECLRALDGFQLMMIEQPLAFDDIFQHSKLQRALKTPICLDESIRHSADALFACEVQACRIVNIKLGRVGGATEARRIHDLCLHWSIPVWCGGMLETGIGRAHNIALSTLPNFTLPGDVSASSRYFERDIIDPPVTVTSDGYIQRPEGVGLGFRVNLSWIEQITVRRESFRPETHFG